MVHFELADKIFGRSSQEQVYLAVLLEYQILRELIPFEILITYTRFIL